MLFLTVPSLVCVLEGGWSSLSFPAPPGEGSLLGKLVAGARGSPWEHCCPSSARPYCFCTVGFSLFALWGGGLVWKRTFPGSSWALGLVSSVLSPCCPRDGGVGQGKVALGGAADVWGELPCPSSIPAAFGVVWEAARGSVHSLCNQSLCVGWAAGLAPGGAWLLFAGRRGRGGSC